MSVPIDQNKLITSDCGNYYSWTNPEKHYISDPLSNFQRVPANIILSGVKTVKTPGVDYQYNDDGSFIVEVGDIKQDSYDFAFHFLRARYAPELLKKMIVEEDWHHCTAGDIKWVDCLEFQTTLKDDQLHVFVTPRFRDEKGSYIQSDFEKEIWEIQRQAAREADRLERE